MLGILVGPFAFARASVIGSADRVFLRRIGQVRIGGAFKCLAVQRLEEWYTPATAGAGGKAVTDHAGHGGAAPPAEIDDLPLGDVEAEANVVILIQGRFP